MEIFNITIGEKNISREGDLEKLPSSTIRYAKVHFDITGDGWDVDERYAIFSNEDAGIEKPAQIDDDGDCFVPHEVISESGLIKVNAVGFNAEDVDEDTQVIEYRITTFQAKLVKCIAVPYDVAGMEEPPTPSLFEQYIALVRGYSQNARSAADEASDSASSASDSASNASNSASSASDSASEASTAANKIVNMTVEAESLPEGSGASVEKTEGDVVNLKFGIPKGDKGDTGDSGTYIGAEEPTDPDVGVWINPEGDDIAVEFENVIVSKSMKIPTAGGYGDPAEIAWTRVMPFDGAPYYLLTIGDSAEFYSKEKIPNYLSQLITTANARYVSDNQISKWNNKADEVIPISEAEIDDI